MIHDKFAKNLLEAALDCGAAQAEIYISEKKETEITIANRKPESVNVKEDSGYGVRVLVDSKLGFYSSNVRDELKAIEKIRKLVNATKLHTLDPFNVIPDIHDKPAATARETYDPRMASAPLSEKIKLATEIEKTGAAVDSRVAGFVWTLYGDKIETFRILSTTGIDATSSGTICYGFAYCYASDGKSVQTGQHACAFGFFDQFDPQEFGVNSAKRALRMLGSRDFQGGDMIALIPPEAGIPLIYSLFGMVEADSVQKGKSPFRNKLGKHVASEKVSIIDDGTLIDGLETRPCDAEGIPTSKTMVMEKGILKNHLYDSYTAKKGKAKSTGNAARMGYSSKPYIAPTNFYLQPGEENEDEILSKINNGIMITELSGLHTGINHATADFSVPAKGILINGGELSQPIDNISIVGNLFDLLKNITHVGRNLNWTPVEGMIGAPSIVVENLRIIGRG